MLESHYAYLIMVGGQNVSPMLRGCGRAKFPEKGSQMPNDWNGRNVVGGQSIPRTPS